MKHYTLLLPFILTSLFANFEKPNIVIFYVDDLGWQDTEINDVDAKCPWETPNIVRLSEKAMNFTEGYSPSPICAPSRISLMNGQDPARTTKTSVRGGTPPANASGLNVLVSPYQPSGMLPEEFTIAKALKAHGYSTGHVGKWHVDNASGTCPSSAVGFDYVSETRGITSKQKPHRLADFATDKEADPYRLDRDGRPYDPTTGDAMTFLEQSAKEDKPFFLYLAHWLVHAPIHTRDRAFLEYNCKKMGIPFPEDPKAWTTPGQTNPYYASMVGTMDWSLGKVMDFLEQTPDPRNDGKMLSETTYLFFSSDNGGMERAGEQTTDNAPLDKGKISTREGGVRVPYLVAGPGIAPKTSKQIVSGLDYFPTILAMTGATANTAQISKMDGVNIFPYLLGEAKAVKDASGSLRDTLYWHFPHGRQDEHRSSIRKGNYKLYKNYLTKDYSLFKLYNADGSRADWEEVNNIFGAEPEIAKELTKLLEDYLKERKATASYYNPLCKSVIPGQDKAPKILSQSFNKDGNKAIVTYETEGKSEVEKVFLYYLLKGANPKKEDWYILECEVEEPGRANVNLPDGVTHFLFSIVDENNFIVSSVNSSSVDIKSFKKFAVEVD